MIPANFDLGTKSTASLVTLATCLDSEGNQEDSLWIALEVLGRLHDQGVIEADCEIRGEEIEGLRSFFNTPEKVKFFAQL